jgi:hypothetical protein
MTDSLSTAAGTGCDSAGNVAVTDVTPMLVYRHDVHKLRSQAHTAAREQVAGVQVNETVRVGTHSKYGFSEFRARPAGDNRVSELGIVHTGDGV